MGFHRNLTPDPFIPNVKRRFFSLITFNNLIIFIFMPVHNIESFSLRWICSWLVIMLEMLLPPLDSSSYLFALLSSFSYLDVKDEWWITLRRMIWEWIAEPPYPICHQWHYRHRVFVAIVLNISVCYFCCCFLYRSKQIPKHYFVGVRFYYAIRFVRFSCSKKLTVHIIHRQTAK